MSAPSTITIDNIKYVREDSIPAQVSYPNNATHPFVVGKNYLIRTVTMTLTGRIVGGVGKFLILSDSAWIADTGRFNEAIAHGKLNEVEPTIGEVFVGIDTIVDAYAWKHTLPRDVK
jgi:hypothetical protein